jgi:Kef-type K+ transport system membrane component KefB
MNDIFAQLAAVLGLSALFGYFVYRFKLPLLVAYLLVGVAISAATAFQFKNSLVAPLPYIGIAFVLFLIGMELDFREIKAFGKTILITCLSQVLITAIAGVTLANLFGFKGLEAQYLGLGLSFSSTVVVVKMLLERKDLTSLYGKLAIGITLIEDIAALVVLMYLSVSDTTFILSSQESLLLGSVIVKALLLTLTAIFFSKFILTRIFKAISSSAELIFLTALTWCFVYIALAMSLGFSIVIGAFLAGLALASSPFHYHISGKVKPLRDFFLVIFFVYLGSQVGFVSALNNLTLIICFTVYALLVKPIIFMLILGTFGFRKHTIFQTAISLSQISEFSLIILILGVDKKIVSESALSVMALTVTFTIICSSIIIANSKRIYHLLRPVLGFFERKNKFNKLEDRVEEPMEDHVVLIGANRVGGPIVDFLKKQEIPFLVLDFDPKVVERLNRRGIKAIYGDLGDTELLDSLNLESAKLIISTASDLADNKLLLSELKRKRSLAKVVVRVSDDSEISELKRRGADYVIFPEDVSADFLVNQLKHHWPNVNLTL